MGFWERGDGDVLGDGPADLLVLLVREHRPSLSALLDAAAVALADVGSVNVADAEHVPARPRLRARFTGASDVVSGGAADRALTEALAHFLFEVQEEYGFALDRKPTLRELLSTFRFVLRGEGASSVSGLPSELTEFIVEAA